MTSWDLLPAVRPAPGAEVRLVHLTQLMMCHLTLEPGARVAEHSHPHEQIGAVLAGGLTLTREGVTAELAGGDVYAVPGGVAHSAVAGSEGCVVLEAFSPNRDDWLAALGEGSQARSE